MNINWRRLATVALIAVAATLASVGTLAVTAAGFTLSFDAIRAVGIAAHIRQDWAWMLPVSVDGAMATATVVAIVMYRLTGKHRIYPWVVLGVGVAVSMASNALHSTGTAGQPLAIADPWVRAAVSTVPAVMLALSFHLLAMLVSMATDRVANGHTVDVDTALAKWVNPRQVANRLVNGQDVANVQTPTLANVQAEDLANGQWPNLSSDVLANGQDVAMAKAELAKQDMDSVAKGVDMANGQSGQELVQETEHWLASLSNRVGAVDSTPPVATAEDLPRRRPRPAVAGGDSPKIDAVEAKATALAWHRDGMRLMEISVRLADMYGVSATTIRRQSWWPSISGRPVSGPPSDSPDEG